ncbi:hypothetical protein [Pelagibius sp. 7325]
MLNVPDHPHGSSAAHQDGRRHAHAHAHVYVFDDLHFMWPQGR